MDREQLNQVLAKAECVFDTDACEKIFDHLAADIQPHIEQALPIVSCVLNGGLMTAAELMKRWHFPLQQDYLHATRYVNNQPTDELHWRAEPSIDPSNRVVVILDDIFDEGTTLAKVVDYYLDRGAKKVITGVMLDKQHDRRKTDYCVDFVGTQVSDLYLFGKGLDTNGWWRNAPGIFALRE